MHETSLKQACFWQIKCELLLAFRHQAESCYPFLFYIMIGCLFPLTASADISAFQHFAPGIVWVIVLFSTLLSFECVFRRDWQNGNINHLLLSPYPLSLLLFAKVIAHWILIQLPIILVTPLIAIAYHLPLSQSKILVFSLLLGTPGLSFLGAVGIALTQGLRQSSVLLTIFLMPLVVPLLIFGSSAVYRVGEGQSPLGILALVGAFSLFCCTLIPGAMAMICRIHMVDQ